MVFRTLAGTVRRLWRGASASGNEPLDDPEFPGGDMASTIHPSGSHSVTYQDICQAREILQSHKLPMELVLEILDLADYQPWKQWTMDGHKTSTASAFYGETNESSVLCLNAGVLSYPFVRSFGDEPPRIRSITWSISSRDQGWTSEGTAGTFRTSSWLDVGILRPNSHNVRTTPRVSRELASMDTAWPLLSDFSDYIGTRGWEVVKHQVPVTNSENANETETRESWLLQSNRVATSTYEDYEVICTSRTDQFEGNEGAGDGNGFLSSIQPGDRILVWARAQYPGWVCMVDSLQMTVNYYV